MFNTPIKKTITEENSKKDFKKLSNYVNLAKGYRTINNFAADCRTNADYLELVINAKISSYPTIPFLKLIADNSEGRVTLKELTLACGYSNYANNDMEQIKNIYVRRGWFAYANFGDRAMDSEIGGHRLVLIIQNDTGNKFSSNTMVIPITSRKKKNMPTHVMVGSDCGLQFDSTISCELTSTISKRRLIQNGIVQKIADCPAHIMKMVEVALLKAQGVIDLRMDEQEAIDLLVNMNTNMNTTRTYQYENNYTRNAMSQVACAY